MKKTISFVFIIVMTIVLINVVRLSTEKTEVNFLKLKEKAGNIIGLSLTTEDGKLEYVKGDTIGLKFSVKKDAYVQLFLINMEGDTVRVYPSILDDERLITPGETIIVPNPELGFRFPVIPPYGKLYIRCLASKKPIKIDSGENKSIYMNFGNVHKKSPLNTINLSGTLKSEEWEFAAIDIITKTAPNYPTQAGDNILNEWTNLNRDSAGLVKRSLQFVSLGPKKVEKPKAPENIIVYYKDVNVVTRGLNNAWPATELKDSPLAKAYRMPLQTKGSRSLSADEIKHKLEQVSLNPNVESAIPNFYRTMYSDNLTHQYMAVQWSLENRYNKKQDTQWKNIHKEIQDIRPALIAVIDQGLTISDNRLKTLAWVNTKEIAGNKKDDDKNGFVDDVHGFNFVEKSNKLYWAEDEFNHGSFCSSIIAAKPVGKKDDIIGISPNSKIITAVALDEFGEGTDLDILNAIHYAAKMGAKVINVSLGGENTIEMMEKYNKAHSAIFDSLEKEGVILVCAAGNENVNNDIRPSVPASLPRPNIVSVMATDADGYPARAKDKNGEWSSFSNYGKQSVDLAAPGGLILGIDKKGSQMLADGTSFATPIVTATLALVWGKHPEWDYKTVIRAVLETTTPMDTLKDKCKTEGLINIEAALKWTPKDKR